jgi:CMP-N-acetylneuraminic acid synthetase
MKIMALIPCKVSSARLKRKNFKVWKGKRLIEHAIEYLLSQGVSEIYITTDAPGDRELAEVAKGYKGVRIIPNVYSKTITSRDGRVTPVNIIHNFYEAHRDLDFLVVCAPDNPIRPDTGIYALCTAMAVNEIHEAYTVTNDLKTSSLWIISQEGLEAGLVSGKVCVIDHPEGLDVDTETSWNALLEREND